MTKVEEERSLLTFHKVRERGAGRKGICRQIRTENKIWQLKEILLDRKSAFFCQNSSKIE